MKHLGLNTISCALLILHANQKQDPLSASGYLPSGEFLLALCEGNHCSGGRRGRDRGNGRILLAQLHSNASSTGISGEGEHHNDTDCRWADSPAVWLAEPCLAGFRHCLKMCLPH